MSAYQHILFSVVDDVATIAINRPEVHNALRPESYAEIGDALARLKSGEISARVLVITGVGKAFSGGADLNRNFADEGGGKIDMGATMERYLNPLLLDLRSLPMPTLAAVNGAAAGSAAGVALACDMVVASASAFFRLAFIHIGLIPDGSLTYALPRLVGRGRAMALAMLGERIPAGDALAMGLVHQVLADETFTEETAKLARKLARMPTTALVQLRAALDASEGNDFAAQLKVERQLQKICGETGDFEEGVAAFREKRPPTFTGR